MPGLLMGVTLLGAGQVVLSLIEAAAALGFVIFVHELGHFMVAKLCGVKCEKFFLGFDIGGRKLWSRQWGETEYGIGVLPLGGYVKMLGQDDNPVRDAEQRKAAQAGHSVAVEHHGDLPAEPTSEMHEPLDPRSYLAQSVPERMAIISAGVIMNLIFAVIFAMIAFRCGVSYTPCVVGDASPGDPAWVAAIRPGDKIIQFNDDKPSEELRFNTDLKMSVMFAGSDEDLKVKVRRGATGQEELINLRPTSAHKAEKDGVVIGVAPAVTNKLGAMYFGDVERPTIPESPAANASPAFAKGDVLEAGAVDDKRTPLENGIQLVALLAQHPDRPISFYVRRDPPKNSPDKKPEHLLIVVDPNPVRRLGLVMEMGPIRAVQKDSPADRAGFKPGDTIVSIDGRPVGDPLRLQDDLRKLAGKKVVIDVRRGEEGHQETKSITVVPRDPESYGAGLVPRNGPGSSDGLGIAYTVTNTLQSIDAAVPKEVGDTLRPGDEIISAEFVQPDGEKKKRFKDLELSLPTKSIEFDADHYNWPWLQSVIQGYPRDAEVELTFRRGKEEHKITLSPIDSKDWFYPERGLVLELASEIRTAESWSEAFSLGLRETKDSMRQVVMTVRMLATGKVAATNLGGPGTILYAAAANASDGFSRLLIFLTFLSANLAVLNFLPIPILDGGHMMFLLYEGIRGKPASERVMTYLTYLGLAFILVLIVFVLGLDIWRGVKWLIGLFKG